MKNLTKFIGTVLLISTVLPLKAQNAQETILHNFGNVYKDGVTPYASLIQGTDGNFYGTTSSGGNTPTSGSGYGTVFQMTQSGLVTILHSFGDGSVTYDGIDPNSSLIEGTDGNFYGTTYGGGGPGAAGTIYKLTSAGKVTILHSFFGFTDGVNPRKLVEGNDGNFYGTTGGSGYNGGTVFKVTPSGVFTILHTFYGDGDGDGNDPHGGVIQGADGNFYGTTMSGGVVANQSYGHGTVYKITPAGNVTIIHSFSDGSVINDGIWPSAGLVQGDDGNFYGTTNLGGSTGNGTIFKVTPAGGVTILHSFLDGSVANDGGYPQTTMVEASDGNFYGTTTSGGGTSTATYGGRGIVFKITPAGELTILHSFGNGGVNGDGTDPNGIIQGRDGNLYGTTVEGGSTSNGTVASGDGTVFKLTVPSIFPTPVSGTECSHIDIGSVGLPGNASYNPTTTGLCTLQGSGAGIGLANAGDGFQMMGVPFSGDSTLVARIDSQTGGGESGVMLRLNLSLFSPYVTVVYQAGTGTVLKWGSHTGSAATVLGSDTTATLPLYVGLVRSGDTFLGYEYVNGAWTLLGTLNAPGTQTNYDIGLVESSDQYNTLGTVTFDGIELFNYAE